MSEASELTQRIRELEARRDILWSVMGGSKSGANVYAAFLEGRRKPSAATVTLARAEGRDLMGEYRELLAGKLAAHAIAKAQATAIGDELRALRAMDQSAMCRTGE
ncbi:hypothetical protein LMG28727_04890 [Paraburkholderia kirstenboschensis]|uniref:hypothetical protein n=1 Tax=Paraburkholderia kirstenboschensis TaxID=1245436 RepID=UPI000A6CCF52|nr:hypothetical protein [Paraburkholderia kirstenboschensis]CAD6548779.1 hypothetical protein LMG28727_04890 [Paraburkholderia kirstenboschensis]